MPAVLGDANFTTYDFMTSPLFHHFQVWPRACTSKDPTVLCEARDYLVNGKGLVWQLSAFFGRGQFQAVVCTNAQAFVHRHVVWCLGETGQASQLPQTELVGKKNTWIYGCLVQVFFQPSDPQIFLGSSGFFTPTSVEVSALFSGRWKCRCGQVSGGVMGINSPLENAIQLTSWSTAAAAGTTA